MFNSAFLVVWFASLVIFGLGLNDATAVHKGPYNFFKEVKVTENILLPNSKKKVDVNLIFLPPLKFNHRNLDDWVTEYSSFRRENKNFIFIERKITKVRHSFAFNRYETSPAGDFVSGRRGKILPFIEDGSASNHVLILWV